MAGFSGLYQQIVQVGHKAVTELHGLAHNGEDRRVHPGFVGAKEKLPGMDGEARMENTVLHPAYKQLRRRTRTCKAANIMAGVGHARQAEPQPHGDVVLHGLPGGKVISRPGLYITLHAGTTGARNEERAFIGPGFHLRLIGGAHHQ
ncbi:hypothetical protein SDC9_163832 [bioreactor metagenome]|uniref:Uncharacterized protein n=1 Tax=bioreactor metagenome TaxID=1076179 RepID=A0A645FPY1_9ZZZZ